MNSRRFRGWLAAATVAGTLLGSTVALAQLEPGGSFQDDDGNVHEGFIEAIAAEMITLGCNPPANDRYCPDDPVTRGQMAAFLVRSLDLPAGEADPFVDDDGSVFESDIEALAAAGITRGCNPPANDRFCPEDVVTREQMAAFLVRALDYPDPSQGDLFEDDDQSVFERDIDRLATAGVTKGCNPPENDRYCPTDPVLRDQMASFLGRALGLQPMEPPPRPTTTTTTVPDEESFGDGIWLVGDDIAPGTYRNSDSSGLCYGARLSGLSGALDDIIANELSDQILIVTIEPTDTAFESSDCGVWSNVLTPRTPSPTASFGGGAFQVGVEVAPGLWRNSDSSESCYWERLSGFSWELDDIITNGLSNDIQTVEIRADDVGFSSNDCGTWTYLGEA